MSLLVRRYKPMNTAQKISYRRRLFRKYTEVGSSDALEGHEKGFKLLNIPSWAFKAQRDGYYYGYGRLERC